MAKGKKGAGIFIRGDDGNLYFISGSDIAKYRLTPSERDCVMKRLKEELPGLIEAAIQDCTTIAEQVAQISLSLSSTPKRKR